MSVLERLRMPSSSGAIAPVALGSRSARSAKAARSIGPLVAKLTLQATRAHHGTDQGITRARPIR
jgi:hypothetical protein